MLDDLKYIHERDVDDTLGIAARQFEQLQYEFAVPELDFHPDNIVYAGMGGSALAGLISSVWPGYTVPFDLVRDYEIPSYVSKKTVFIAASYSGNTEETLSALEKAETQGATILVIASGGKLAEIAKQKGYPLALLPKAEQPRYAVFYNLRALLTLMHKMRVVAVEDSLEQLAATTVLLQEKSQIWLPTVPAKDNPAKRLAQELMGKSVVIYAGPKLFPAAYKWKISCNENAKQVAWTNELPEFNHNEFIGWSKQPVQKPYAIVDLRSTAEHPRVQKRFEVTERLLSGMRPAPFVIRPEGKTLLEQLLWTIAFGDFVTLYLGLLNGLNPAPVDLVEKFKLEMNK